MNYDEKIAPVAEEQIRPLAEKRDRLCQQVTETIKKIQAEKDEANRLEQQISQDKRKVAEAMLEGFEAYEKAKAGLHNRVADLSTLKEIIITLETDTLPGLKSQLAEASKRLSDALRILCRTHRGLCEERLSVLAGELIEEIELWYDCFDRLYARYNAGGFSRNADGCTPAIKHTRLDPSHPPRIIPLECAERLARQKKLQEQS